MTLYLYTWPDASHSIFILKEIWTSCENPITLNWTAADADATKKQETGCAKNAELQPPKGNHNRSANRCRPKRVGVCSSAEFWQKGRTEGRPAHPQERMDQNIWRSGDKAVSWTALAAALSQRSACRISLKKKKKPCWKALEKNCVTTDWHLCDYQKTGLFLFQVSKRLRGWRQARKLIYE